MNVVLRLAPERVEELRACLRRGGFKIESRPNALLFAQRPGVNVTAYASGKLLLQGAQADEYAGILAGEGIVDAAPPTVAPPAGGFAPHAGSDESGKGDYFGPLCVASVFVPDAATAEALVAKGVRDSKLVPDAEAAVLASLVRARCPHAVRVLLPPEYNDAYERVGNLNVLLARVHADALEELLARAPVDDVLVDQFASPDVLERQLRERARAVRVRQATQAESDVAVAAASLVARAEFLAGLRALEVRHGVKLPKGAGLPVTRAGKDIVARGKPALREVAKLHFATTRAVGG